MRRLFILICLIGCTFVTQSQTKLIHVKGSQSVGLRGGIGTKNKVDVGLIYTYSFNQKMNLAVELDREYAVFGQTDFVNDIMIAPGIEYTVWQPTRWMYCHVALHGCFGYDTWKSKVVSRLYNDGFVYGANVGAAVELFPWPFLSTIVKAQQYMIFGNGDQYLKPNFSLGIKYHFHF